MNMEFQRSNPSPFAASGAVNTSWGEWSDGQVEIQFPFVVFY